MEQVDAVVVGAGFGGLGAALRLAERGARVVVCEALNYPGGCASTFTHRGTRYDAGATTALGVLPGGALRAALDRHGIALEIRPLAPALELRAPGWRATLPADLSAAGEGFCAELSATAAALAPLLVDDRLLPPWGPAALARHAARLPAYGPLLRQIGRPLVSVLRRHGVDRPEVRRLLEPLCRITVQCGVDEAEAPFALGAIDALATSAAHVRGGMGALADGLVAAVRAADGEVRFADRVKALERGSAGWEVRTRTGALRATTVLANVLPQALPGLGVAAPDGLARRVTRGWGAAMLYLTVDPDVGPPDAFHLSLSADPARPYVDGNHVFCSVSDVCEQRVVVASAHLSMPTSAEQVAAAQARMRDTIAALAPEIGRASGFTASPRTFERFTRRPGGWVGGIPRRAGWESYRDLWPQAVAPGLFLVGDSVGLGQSTLSAFVSGGRIADLALRAVRPRSHTSGARAQMLGPPAAHPQPLSLAHAEGSSGTARQSRSTPSHGGSNP